MRYSEVGRMKIEAEVTSKEFAFRFVNSDKSLQGRFVNALGKELMKFGDLSTQLLKDIERELNSDGKWFIEQLSEELKK